MTRTEKPAKTRCRALRNALPPILLALALLSFPGTVLPALVPAAPAASGKCTLDVQATGFRSQEGKAGGAVFTSPDGWPEQMNKAYISEEFPILGDHALLSFQLPPGEYAVVVLDDKNENSKLDRNFLGIPEEGFGFANNPPVFLTAPSFDEAKVDVACPVTDIHVKLVYK